MPRKNRVFGEEFRVAAARRMNSGESPSALSRELKVKRSLLYRWRDAYRKEGPSAFQRGRGRPSRVAERRLPSTRGEEAAARRITELERKIGQQALDIDFLRRAFKRVKESRRSNGESGATASTERSGQ